MKTEPLTKTEVEACLAELTTRQIRPMRRHGAVVGFEDLGWCWEVLLKVPVGDDFWTIASVFPKDWAVYQNPKRRQLLASELTGLLGSIDYRIGKIRATTSTVVDL